MSMEIDDEEVEVTTSSSSRGDKKRFEVKKVTFITRQKIHRPSF